MSLNRHPQTRRRSLRQFLQSLILGGDGPADPKRGRLLLESLEKRQLLAGDVELLFTDGSAEDDLAAQQATLSALATGGFQIAAQAEGELAPDLVQFAKDLAASGAQFFGAHWCPFCTEQSQLFADGGDYLPFIEVTNPDRTLNSIGQAEGITTFPTWKFPGEDPVTGVLSLQELSDLSGVPIPQSESPTFAPIGDLTVQVGSPLHIPIDAYDPQGGVLTVTVSVDNPGLLEAVVLSGNRSIRIDMQGYGDMVFELFEQRAETASGRVIELAESGFYDGIIFHRIVDDFVIQGGDPTGTGTSGSNLGSFDDDFHPELQHNREGVLSFAKSSDDTNNSQFFITEVPTRFLDFNHSVFGQLVEGFDVREAISETSTPESRGAGASQKPDNNITINTIEVFEDTENSVVMLRPTGVGTGTTNVTFTVTDTDGNSFSETVQVAVVGDTANSQPFLNDIAPQPSSPINNPVQLQLSSIDVEGDAVTYFAQSLSSTSNGTVSVDANTGLVTVTPANDFAGTINVRVGVRPGPGVTGNGSNDSDTQTVAFVFEGESALAPTGVDLQAGSDTGASDSDNVTNAGTLSFLVSGVTSGASVQLIDTSTNAVVGTGLATGSTIVISTSNIAALGDGTYQIAARQVVGNDASALSPTLALTYDSTSPASVVASASTQANVGRAFRTDLISSEEGSGLTYALTAAPTGATINSTTGVINWTPTASQEGDHTFSVELTDLAGNQRSEDFTVTVSEAPTAEIRLEITDLQGNPITSVAVGESFLLNMVAVDARPFNKPGIYGAFADILFDSTLVRPDPGSSIEYADGFGLVRKGTFTTGLIDELGAVNSSLAASNLPENLIATVRMEAIGSGTVSIRSEPADEVDSEFLLFGIDDRLPASAVAYGSVSLAIGQSFTTEDDTITVAEDSGKTTVNVLQNDQIVSGSGSLTVVSVTQPASGGLVSLEGGVVSFTPADDFHGTSVFTYRVSDSQGIQETASVTVTVTPVNDPPVGQDDTLNVDQDSGDNFLDVLDNDSFAPDSGETLVVTAVGNATTSNGGTVSVAANGSGVNYRPAAGFTGTDTFTYTVSDGSLEDVVSVTVTVMTPDNPPDAVDNAFDVVEDDAEASFDILANDTRDVDDQPFVIDSLGTPSNGGSVRIANNGTEFFYAPAADFEGTETVTYTIRDTGGGLAVATVTFTVSAVNDAPPVIDTVVPLNRGTNNNPVFSLDDLPSNVDSNEVLTLSVTEATSAGGTATVDSATQEILYTPPADFVGTDTISYTVSDGSDLVSSGTITVAVSDFAPRDIMLTLPNLATKSRINGITLTGTDLVGNAVDMPIEYNGDTASFDNLLPGNYTIRIPAIPFLQNASEPREIAVSSAADAGDAIVESGLGRLRARFVSIHDWLGSAPRQSILTVVTPGETGTLAAVSSATNLASPSISLDGSGSLLTVQGTRSETSNGTTTQSDVQATVPTENDSRVLLRGQENGMFLYRIDTSRLNFTPVAASSSAPEGESVATNATSLFDTASSGEGEQTSAANAWTIGEVQAEGESAASASITQADLFVPTSNLTSTRTDATVLPLAEGELWVGSSLQSEEPAVSSQSIDSAMQTVAEDLTRISQSGDEIAEQSSQAGELNASAIDQALSLEL